MKKGLTIIVFILFAFNVTAMSVTLGEPRGTKTTSTITFGCTVTATGEGLLRLTLWHNIVGSFQANETNSSAVTDGSEYTFTINNVPNGNYEWNCEASNGTDSVKAGSNNVFTVSVSTNNAPVYTEIPIQTWPKNESKSIDLNSYFSDPDGDSLTYTSSTPSSISVSISGANATLTPQSWYGTTTITFTADDGKGGTNSTTATLNVIDVNTAPYNKTEYMKNVTWEPNTEKTVDLDDYFDDADGDILTYSFRYSSGGTHYINITIDNSSAEATLTPATDWKGVDYVIFTAYDGKGGYLDSNEVMLTVKGGEAVNHAPEIKTRSPLINPMLLIGDSQRFTIQKYDQDLDDLTVRWYLNSEEQTEYRNRENYTFLALNAGSYELKVEVTDNEFTVSEVWNIQVQGVAGEQPPEQLPLEQTYQAVCGNGKVEGGETCSTCPADVICPQDYNCENDVCVMVVKKSNLKLVLMVMGGFIIFAALTIFIYKYHKRRTLFGGWEPKYTGNAQNVQLAVKPKEETVVTTTPTTLRMPPATLDAKKKTVNEVLLKHYILTNLKKGETMDKLREKLKKAGWSDEKIDEAYKAAQLDETFK